MQDIAVIARAINNGDHDPATLLAMADALTELGQPWSKIWPWQWMAEHKRRPEPNKGRANYLNWHAGKDNPTKTIWEWSRNELMPNGLPIPWDAWNRPSWRRRYWSPLSAYRRAAQKLEEVYPGGRGLLLPALEQVSTEGSTR